MFLAANLQGIVGDIEVMLGICFQNMSFDKRLFMFDLQITKLRLVS